MSKYKVTPLDYDLTVAESGLTESVSGHRIQLQNTTDPDAEVSVALLGNDNIDGGYFPLSQGDFVEIPESFDRIKIKWDAQSGVVIKLLVISMATPPKGFNYRQNERGIIEAISQPVNVRSGTVLETMGDVTVSSASATLIDAVDNKRQQAIITNTGANPARYGDANVTATRGDVLNVGDKVAVDTSSAFYGIGVGGDTTFTVTMVKVA